MRGKGKGVFQKFFQKGITPAYAGKSVARNTRKSLAEDHPRVCGEKLMADGAECKCGQDHPRVCGEKCVTIQVLPVRGGSPPRMRGKVTEGDLQKAIDGITPAYAGKRRRLSGNPARNKDHPRVCGEKKIGLIRWQTARGSPPRMRGKDVKAEGIVTRVRITPAYAGKSFVLAGRLERPEGSPPRMRGKGLASYFCYFEVGITPAYAGKRVFHRQNGSDSRDHPRVCGEKFPFKVLPDRNSGSPPRMRGKVYCTMPWLLCQGITPAYAGKSHQDRWALSRLRDHPRVCGEKWMENFSLRNQVGSPPRMRGKVAIA